MAFNIKERFQSPNANYRFYEPGAYQNLDGIKIEQYKAPFLTKSKRNTNPGNRLWTHAIYYANVPSKIPNCTSMMSKCPRFPYELLSKEDLEALLCRCGIQNVCDCMDETEQKAEITCQGKINRRLFKGYHQRSGMAEGISVPSKRDRGFEILPDGTRKRLFTIEKEQSPPFYDANVTEFTAFYQGCKWSRWKSKRSTKLNEIWPGPADYTVTKERTYDEICADKVREQRRKNSNQLRFIEIIQQKGIKERRPGPATYNPRQPQGTKLDHFGPKAKRFMKSVIEQQPGPSAYWIRRDFNLPASPMTSCHAKLPEPSFFGTKAGRFKLLKTEGPSPATYSPNYKNCNVMHCSRAPFGSSSARFKDPLADENDKNELNLTQVDHCQDDESSENCPNLTWQFRSKTKRMPTLQKKPFEQSPADLPMCSLNIERAIQLQYAAPFYASEGRFQPWHDWMPVIGTVKTAGPGYYDPVKPICLPAVFQGPLSRTERFSSKRFQIPAPNTYKIGGGVENVLTTYNKILKKNMENKHKFIWKSPVESKKLPLEEQENILLQKSIALLDVDGDNESKPDIFKAEDTDKLNKPKLLNCFLYSKPLETYF